MTIEEYHESVMVRLLSLYRALPLEHCVQVIDAIADIEELYYNKWKEMNYDQTTRELDDIKTKFIHPEKTKEDNNHNRELRARCVALGTMRYNMVKYK